MARLYAVETNLTVTGMNADHRLRVKPSDVQRFGLSLLGRLAAQVPALSRYAPLAQRLPAFPRGREVRRRAGARPGPGGPRRAGFGGTAAAGRPARRRARRQLRPGERLRRPGADGAARLGVGAARAAAAGRGHARRPGGHARDHGLEPGLRRAVRPQLRQGALAGAAFGLPLALPGRDRRARGLVLPALHPLESWGDARAHDGTVTFVQPLIAPLYAGVTEVEVLAALLGEGDRTAYTQLRELWQARTPDDFELDWEKWLADGFVGGSATRPETVSVRHDQVLAAAMRVAAAADGGRVEINIVPDYKVYDGRFAQRLLAAGAARPGHQAHLGQRGAAGAADRRASWACRRATWSSCGWRPAGARAGGVRRPATPRTASPWPWATAAAPRRRRSATASASTWRRSRRSDAPWFAPGAHLVPTGEQVRAGADAGAPVDGGPHHRASPPRSRS